MGEDEGFRAGFVCVLGRSNVGKSSLINALAGAGLSIVSWHLNTTRRPIRTITRGSDHELVLIDTPGLAKTDSRIPEELNYELVNSDFALYVVDARRGVTSVDARILGSLNPRDMVAINKIDLVSRASLLPILKRLSDFELSDYLLVSARSGYGVEELRDVLRSKLPVGPPMYEPDVRIDMPIKQWYEDLVREALLVYLREELPYVVTCRIDDYEDERFEVGIYVERESQKAIVIGKDGRILRAVRDRLRRRLPPGTEFELRVKVRPELAGGGSDQ